MARLLAISILLSAIWFRSQAQEVTGSIVGNVVDSSGSPIPGSKVTVTSTDRRAVVRSIDTNSDGEFVATLLPIGNYSLEAAKPGFKVAVEKGIELHVNDKLTFRLKLEVGQVTESVTVEAEAVSVETQSPTSAGLISGTEVTELSLNNRNFMQLLSLMPGVTSNAASDELFVGVTNPLGGTNSIPFSINGGRSSGNNFMVDGADNVDRGSNLTLLNYPSVDSIAEFKGVRSSYTAESGRGATGQINVVTKSGTNEFHGNAYEFFRNDAIAANNFFNNLRNIPRPELRYNDFGYTLGGPLPIFHRKGSDKNRTFFFWSQEFRRIITYTTLQATVPTDAMKTGAFVNPVCVDYTGNVCNATSKQITNINPIAAAYIKDVWSKIPAGDPGTFNLFTPQRVLSNSRQELIKIDHTFTARYAVSVRFVKDSIPTQEPGGLFTGAVIPNTATTSTNSPGRNLTVRSTSSFSSSLLNEAGWSYSYGAVLSDPVGLMASKNSPDIAVSLPFPVTLARVPSLSVGGLSTLTGYGPYRDYNRNHNIFDNLVKLMGNHTLKTGVSINFYQKTENAASANAGTFTFPSTPRPSGASTVEQGWANFLLGNVSTFTQASLDLTPDMRARQFEAYIQDDYRVSARLTVNAGVRYSLFLQPYDANHLLTNFDPALWDPAKAPQIDKSGNIVAHTGDPLNGIIINGKNSPYGAKAENENLHNFAPRIGFAWDPFGKGRTAIRSGYGISYDSTLVGIYEQNAFANPPFVNSISITNTRLENPTAGVVSVSAAPKSLHGTPLPASTPYTQQWSFDVQQQLGRNFILDVGYFGSKSTHLLGIVDMNEVPPGLAVASGILTAAATSATAPLLNQLRPFRGYTSINSIESWFNSNYNSLQVSMQKALRTNSSLRLSYTWSKVMTDAGSDRSNAPQNFYDRAADYARAPFDRTQVLTISYVYHVPLARHSTGFVSAVAKGWEMSGITTLNSGLPLRVTSSLGLDWAGLGLISSGTSVSIRPDQVGDANANAPHTIAQWFNTKAFAAVPPGQFRPGNAAAVSVQGPGFQRWDVSFFKTYSIRESLHLQMRAETFNFVNHTNFQGVSTALGATNYGQVTSAREPRRIQVAAKLIF
jgi:hypothetical protein